MNIRSNRSRAFTLVELLVVIAIIAIMVILAVPALSGAREAARRATCMKNQLQIIMGVNNYETAFGVFPAGTLAAAGPVRSEAIGYHQSWLVRILPYVDEPAAYRQVDFSQSVYDVANAAVRGHTVLAYRCPSAREFSRDVATSNYAGVNHHVEAPIDETGSGMFVLNRFLAVGDVADGLSSTLFTGEKLADFDLGWMSGTRATLRNTGTPLHQRPSRAELMAPPAEPLADAAEPAAAGDAAVAGDDAAAGVNGAPAALKPPPVLQVGGFSSQHNGGLVVFAFGDAHVQPISSGIDMKVLEQLANRADGSLVSRDAVD